MIRYHFEAFRTDFTPALQIGRSVFIICKDLNFLSHLQQSNTVDLHQHPNALL